ncbi:bifunctional 3-dehydroquinate dehydratase/shikimate dehydrogenase protein [Polystyrenella longa]|uniref:Bifunctional 3-dehydroquinate dehydratase/shikimate dehydrogenase protein n=1 Tax=Polystyrenella longa TaxID=2528007 RepID=A0A518CHV5_9PLAN|nr:type I 3-dehydroquinate dehydratase [Polystyrenella longa]QDU78806.1 bifunctional 3-dehydroquinate dehydratase/shikimate dehydrogenase protein [Polystyrenella longa]
MLTVSVIPTSRRLAAADLLNASHHCDVIELCLDHLIKEPDVGKLAHTVETPMIISCRTPEEGGAFSGSSAERVQMLKLAIVAEPMYVELDTSIASSIPRYGKTKRVVSVRGSRWSSEEWQSAYLEAANQDADYVKLVTEAHTLEEAWPLLKLLTGKQTVPIIPVVEGAASLMFSLLTKKYGSPWTYAALEPGRESFPGQPSVWDLRDVYQIQEINSKTRFMGMVGFGDIQNRVARTLNRAYAAHDHHLCCLPFLIGQDHSHLEKLLNALKIHALLIGSEMAVAMSGFANELDESAQQSKYCDLLIQHEGQWKGYNFIWRSVLRGLEDVLQQDEQDPRPLNRRNVIVVGATGMAQAVAFGVQRRKGILSLSSPKEQEGQRLAEMFDCRHVPFHAIYETLADVIILADAEVSSGAGRQELNPSFFRPNMVVLDLTNMPELSLLGKGAEEHQSKIVPCDGIFFDLIRAWYKATTGDRLEQDEVRELWKQDE